MRVRNKTPVGKSIVEKDVLSVKKIPADKWKIIGQGGESNIYEMPDGDLAKIFRHWNDSYFTNNFNPNITKTVQNKFWDMQNKLLNIPEFPDNVVKPIRPITTEKGSIIGYTMKKIDNVITLDRLCKIIRQKEKLYVLCALYDLISSLHALDIIIGDLVPRDLAWDRKNQKIYLWDSDGMSFSGYECRAFSLGYVDRELLSFTKNSEKDILVSLKKPYEKISDWIAFQAICLNVLVGLDPFEGTHKKYWTKEERVMHNISIFSKDVIYPETALPLAMMPRPLLSKIFLTFQHSDRTIPEKQLLEKGEKNA